MKEYQGKKYAISCRQLGVAETKDESYQAANAWWLAKKHGLDAASRPRLRPLLPMEDLAAAFLDKQGPLDAEDVGTLLSLETALRASRANGLEVVIQIDKGGNATIWPADLGRLPRLEDQLAAAVEAMGGRVVTQLVKGNPLPDRVTELLPPARVQQVQDSISGLRGEATAPAEKTVAANCERWVALQQAKVAGGKLAPDRADGLRIQLTHFRDFLGGTAAVDGVDAQKLESFYRWCMAKVQERQNDQDGKAGWSAIYAKKVFDTARVFVRYLWESSLIELPRNIDSREFGFRVGAKAIETWTAKEFQTALAAATGQLRLHLLLMANCGFTQEDISDLLDAEVDWRDGRIIRKRSKTREHANVPVVNYKLWPSTFALLKEYRSGQERALLTKSGKPWKRKELIDGKLVKCDNIVGCYANLKKKLKGFDKPLKWLRRMGATLLDSRSEYSRFSEMYLGHSPRGVKDRYYSAPDQQSFDEAVTWLGQQLRQVEDKPAARPARRKTQAK
jgi:integrase